MATCNCGNEPIAILMNSSQTSLRRTYECDLYLNIIYTIPIASVSSYIIRICYEINSFCVQYLASTRDNTIFAVCYWLVYLSSIEIFYWNFRRCYRYWDVIFTTDHYASAYICIIISSQPRISENFPSSRQHYTF